ALSGAGTAADPLRVGGMALVLDGVPADTDRFLLQPTAQVAGKLAVAITDPSRIAAATPVKVEAPLDNIGTGQPSAIRVTDGAHADLLAPAEIEFLDGDQYMIDGTGPHAWTPGSAIS